MTNGFESSFKVFPVQMVAKVSKASRENGRQKQRQSNSSKNSLFDSFLNRPIESESSAEGYTVTYNADRQLQTYYYRQSKEYTF